MSFMSRRTVKTLLLVGITTTLASCCLCPEPEKKEGPLQDIELNDISRLYRSQDSAELPEFACIQDVQTKKQIFFGYTLNLVREHNDMILETRQTVLALRDKFALSQTTSDKIEASSGVAHASTTQNDANTALTQDSPPQIFTEEERLWLKKLARTHRINTKTQDARFFDQLLFALDVIPASMALAQAANESAWGTSRFAIEANNLFGQWCFKEGCGLVPQLRPEGATYEVKVFSTPSESVGQYMLNINRNSSYQKVRNIRHSYRAQGQEIPGSSVVGGLKSYSARGDAYIEELRHMIGYNELAQWDDHTAEYPDISQLEIPSC